MVDAAARRSSRAAWLLTLALFAAALGVRLDIFEARHVEGDERLYAALVEQLDAGRGYTLQGHPILERSAVVREQYDRPLFYHPPGGIGLFWLFTRALGERGPGAVQLAAFALFFWSTVALGRLALERWDPLAALLVAALAGFTPIAAHVGTHYWLDGPQLALASAGCALFAFGVVSGRIGWAGPAGLLLGWACLTKLSALAVLPGVFGLAWALRPRPLRRLVWAGALALGAVALCVLPWLALQWSHYGELFPSWAGRPAPALVARNPFVYYVTVVREPWSYLTLLPFALATLVPSLLLLAFSLADARVRRIGGVLLAWIVWLVAIHAGLGAIGYSKLLRYLILVTPASVLLLALVFDATCRRERLRGRIRAALGATLLAAAALALLLEVSLGLQYIRQRPEHAMMVLYPDHARVRALEASGP